jgi:DNA-binding transcriptional LysR family regulator
MSSVTAARPGLSGRGSETSVTVNGRLRVGASEGISEAVLGDLGRAIASERAFAPELKSAAIVSVLQDWLLPPVDLWAVFPAGRQASAKARAFASFVQSEVSNSGAEKWSSNASLSACSVPTGLAWRESKSGGTTGRRNLVAAA